MKIQRRQFWNYSNGSCVGYIELINRQGYIFKNDNIWFKITSSNLSNTESQVFSIECLSYETKQLLLQYMNEQCNINVKYKYDLIGLPWKGNILQPMYVTDVHKICEEVLNVKL